MDDVNVYDFCFQCKYHKHERYTMNPKKKW